MDEQTFKVKVLNKKFYKEMHPVEEATDAPKIDDLPQGKYVKNVVLMTIIWTNSSFSMYTLNYMNKHFEGNIFLNFYLDGAAGIVGTLIAAPLYSLLKIRWSFFTTLVCINVFLLLFFLHQENIVTSKWIEAFGYPQCPYPEGSEEEQEYHKKVMIPVWIFCAKVFVNTTFLNAYQASYNEDVIFPFYKRATSIGICNFVARTVTIAAPLVAELDRPLPALILLAFNFVSLISSIFLPTSDEEAEFAARKKQLLESKGE